MTDPSQDDTHDDEAPTPQLTESQAKRLSTPMIGMVITVAVLSLVLAGLWFMNPEPDTTYTRDENVQEAAAWTASTADFEPVAPDVPQEWSANYARWQSLPEHELEAWEVGYTTGSRTFVGFAQTDAATASWVNAETDQTPASGEETVGGLRFEIRETEDRRYYVLDTEDNHIDGTTVVISGDAADAEFSTAVEAIVAALGEPVEDPASQPSNAPEGT